MTVKSFIEEKKASFGVNAATAEPTGVRAKKSKIDKTNPEGMNSNPQGSSKLGTPNNAATSTPFEAEELEGDELEESKSSARKITKEDIDMSDDIEALFGDADFTAEFKAKAADMVATAVAAKVNEQLESIAEELNSEVEAEVSTGREELVEQIDAYLDFVIENFMKENELAVESGLRAEIAEDFLQGMRTLFTEHFIDIPDEKVSVVDELATRLEDAEEKLNEQITANVQLKEINESFERAAVVAELTEDLVDTQAAKLQSLSEAIDFTTADEFKEKVAELREGYFTSSTKDTTRDLDLDPTEGADSITEGEESNVEPAMRGYMDALDRSQRK